MELLQYDAQKDELVMKMDGQELNYLASLLSGVCATADMQDFTALGVTEEYANKLRVELYRLLTTTNKLLKQKNGF